MPTCKTIYLISNRLQGRNLMRFPPDIVKITPQKPQSRVHLDPDTYRVRSRICLVAADVLSSRQMCPDLLTDVTPANSTSGGGSWAIWSRTDGQKPSRLHEPEIGSFLLSAVFCRRNQNRLSVKPAGTTDAFPVPFKIKSRYSGDCFSTSDRTESSQHIGLELVN